MTVLRSEVVGTPPTDLLLALLVPSEFIAGPTTAMAAEPICEPLSSSTRNWSSLFETRLDFQPFGAGSPEGKSDGADSTGEFFLTLVFDFWLISVTWLMSFSLASRIWRTRMARLRLAMEFWRFF